MQAAADKEKAAKATKQAEIDALNKKAADEFAAAKAKGLTSSTFGAPLTTSINCP